MNKFLSKNVSNLIMKEKISRRKKASNFMCANNNPLMTCLSGFTPLNFSIKYIVKTRRPHPVLYSTSFELFMNGHMELVRSHVNGHMWKTLIKKKNCNFRIMEEKKNIRKFEGKEKWANENKTFDIPYLSQRKNIRKFEGKRKMSKWN